MSISHGVRETLKDERDAARLRVAELEALINNPHTANFLEAVRLEAAHQRERWGEPHDREKSPEHWFWLVGYLAGKALRAAITFDTEKARHHCISSAAALSHWYATIQGLELKDADLAAHDSPSTSGEAE